MLFLPLFGKARLFRVFLVYAELKIPCHLGKKIYFKTHIVLLNYLKIVFLNFVPLRAAGKVLWLILGPNVKSDLTSAEYKQNQV